MTKLQNRFQLIGRLGQPVEVIRPEGRDPIAKLLLAVENGYRDRESQQWVERTIWHDVVAYNPRQVESLEKHAVKGQEITVEGMIGKDVFDSRTRQNEDGSPAKDSRVTLILSGFRLGRKPGEGGQAPQGASAAHAGAPAPAHAGGPEDDDIPY